MARARRSRASARPGTARRRYTSAASASARTRRRCASMRTRAGPAFWDMAGWPSLRVAELPCIRGAIVHERLVVVGRDPRRDPLPQLDDLELGPPPQLAGRRGLWLLLLGARFHGRPPSRVEGTGWKRNTSPRGR